MLQTQGTKLYSEHFLKPAIQVAGYYGFMPIQRIIEEARRTNRGLIRQKRKSQLSKSLFDRFNYEHFHALQTYFDNGFEQFPSPVLFYHTSKAKSAEDLTLLSLQAIGSSKSITEALIIKTALDILDEINVKNVCVHINTTGDRDSTARYNKALQIYLRKHVNAMPTAAQSALKKDPFHCLAYLSKKAHYIFDDAPQSMEFLSEQSRKHMRELLEYFEMTDVPYIIDKSLVEYEQYYPKIIFEIRSMCDKYEPEECGDVITYARGYRYDELSRRAFKTDIPAASISFEYKKNSKDHDAVVNPRSIRKPKIHFIQFGFDAKLKSLNVIDQLRKAKIPIYQSLGNDTLALQLDLAEQMKVPYTIIMGQKEVIDDTVIIRNMKTRAQDIIPVLDLTHYLKKIRV